MNKKFYIVRNEHSNPEADWLYAMTETMIEAMEVCRTEKLKDAAIQICKGDFPFNYEITKTFTYKPHK